MARHSHLLRRTSSAAFQYGEPILIDLSRQSRMPQDRKWLSRNGTRARADSLEEPGPSCPSVTRVIAVHLCGSQGDRTTTASLSPERGASMMEGCDAG